MPVKGRASAGWFVRSSPRTLAPTSSCVSRKITVAHVVTDPTLPIAGDSQRVAVRPSGSSDR